MHSLTDKRDKANRYTKKGAPDAGVASSVAATGGRKKNLNLEPAGAGLEKTKGLCFRSDDSRLLTHKDFVALEALQKGGYGRVGLKDAVKSCGTRPVIKDKVGLAVSTNGGMQVCGMQKCGSRWCVDCWPKVVAGRQDDIDAVLEWALDEKHTLVFMTLTAAHFTQQTLDEAGGNRAQAIRQQDITELFDCLTSAWRRMGQGRAGKRLKESWIGFIRSFELTVDNFDSRRKTGVHGHYHVVLVLDNTANLDLLRELVFARWAESARKVGLSTNRKAFDWKVIDGNDYGWVSEYLTKGEKTSLKADDHRRTAAESLSYELSNSAGKISNGGNRTSPEGLLRYIGALSPAAFEKRSDLYTVTWRNIENACRGRRYLTWSRDIRSAAGLGMEQTDDELVNARHQTKNGKIAVVTYSDVEPHLATIKRAVYVAKPGDKWGALTLMLDMLGIEFDTWSETDFYDEIAESYKLLRGG